MVAAVTEGLEALWESQLTQRAKNGSAAGSVQLAAVLGTIVVDVVDGQEEIPGEATAGADVSVVI